MKSRCDTHPICHNCGSPVLQRVATLQEPYHYDLSGLRDGYLAGITIEECPKCKIQSPIIPRIAELHAVIAKSLVDKSTLLTGAELRFLRKWAGFPAKQFAALLWIDASHLSRVENGKTRHLGAPVDKLARAMTMAASDREFTRNILLHIAESRIQQRKRKPGEKAKAPVFKLVSNRWNRAA
jgi:transcriptional regulator with XRE-family HTH domain